MVGTHTFSLDRAGWRDLGPLRELENKAFEQDAWPLIDLIAVLTMPGVVRIKASVDDQMVGFIGGDRRSQDQVGWIITLAVKEGYRRQGIATALLHAAEKELGTPVVRLSVRRSNESAKHLYEREGYHSYTVWPGYYPGGEDALVLEKRLTF